MSLDKQFHGDLEAVSQGEMLSQFDREKQSGGYVAIERVTGTLGGRKGSFTLQHASTMVRGTPHQNIVVVPDSGSDELTGLKGSLIVNIAADGAHSYDFEYTFEPARERLTRCRRLYVTLQIGTARSRKIYRAFRPIDAVCRAYT